MAVSFCETSHKPFYIHTDHWVRTSGRRVAVSICKRPTSRFIYTLIMGVRTRSWRSLLQNDPQALPSGPGRGVGGWRCPAAKRFRSHFIHTLIMGIRTRGWRIVVFLCKTVQCCFTSTETLRTIRDGEPRTATSTFTQLLSSDRSLAQFCFPSTEIIRLIRGLCPDFHTAPEIVLSFCFSVALRPQKPLYLYLHQEKRAD